MNLLLAIFLLLEAVYEGLRTGGHLFAAELVEMVYLSGITYMAYAWLNSKLFTKVSLNADFVKVLIGCVLLRFALFDSIWNISAGQNLFYYGTTKFYDRFMTELGSWGWMWKGISLIWGIAWLTKWGNNDRLKRL